MLGGLRRSMAKALGIGQDGMSKIEKRADLMISTLRKTVEAMGGPFFWSRNFPTASPSCCQASLRRSQTRDPQAASSLTQALINVRRSSGANDTTCRHATRAQLRHPSIANELT